MACIRQIRPCRPLFLPEGAKRAPWPRCLREAICSSCRSVAVLPFFMMERPTFLRERTNGAYGVGAWTVANFLCSLPGLALISILSTVCVVPLAGLNGFGVFFAALLQQQHVEVVFTVLLARGASSLLPFRKSKPPPPLSMVGSCRL